MASVNSGGDEGTETGKDPTVETNVTHSQLERADALSETLTSVKGTRVIGTCEWILRNKDYQQWLDGSNHLLWISGGPGKGKTMLSNFLIEKLERRTAEMNDAYQDEKRNTAVTILRGLVHQIVTKRPKLIQHAFPYFETPSMTQQTLSSLETLWIILRKLFEDPGFGTMFCVLDGLDECDEDSRRILVSKLVDLLSPKNSSPATAVIRLAIVSREVLGLQDCARVKLDPDNNEGVASDIERFISARMNEVLWIEGSRRFRQKWRRPSLNELRERTCGWASQYTSCRGNGLALKF
ncbi:hypothetical protein N0V90_001725 [Kalmusia sp. IMI 367209]|nr:hypothetical protein N0V90_001725 [Kalmusia sp. IMI 367209]